TWREHAARRDGGQAAGEFRSPRRWRAWQKCRHARGPTAPPATEVSMQYGVTIFPTEYAIRPDELARALEERGFESLFVPEHTHIPVSRRTPYPAGGEL